MQSEAPNIPLLWASLSLPPSLSLSFSLCVSLCFIHSPTCNIIYNQMCRGKITNSWEGKLRPARIHFFSNLVGRQRRRNSEGDDRVLRSVSETNKNSQDGIVLCGDGALAFVHDNIKKTLLKKFCSLLLSVLNLCCFLWLVWKTGNLTSTLLVSVNKSHNRHIL